MELSRGSAFIPIQRVVTKGNKNNFQKKKITIFSTDTKITNECPIKRNFNYKIKPLQEATGSSSEAKEDISTRGKINKCKKLVINSKLGIQDPVDDSNSKDNPMEEASGSSESKEENVTKGN